MVVELPDVVGRAEEPALQHRPDHRFGHVLLSAVVRRRKGFAHYLVPEELKMHYEYTYVYAGNVFHIMLPENADGMTLESIKRLIEEKVGRNWRKITKVTRIVERAC